MMEILVKMYAMTKRGLIEAYGEEFTAMTEEAQAAAVLKALSDVVKFDQRLAAIIAEGYLKDIA